MIVPAQMDSNRPTLDNAQVDEQNDVTETSDEYKIPVTVVTRNIKLSALTRSDNRIEISE